MIKNLILVLAILLLITSNVFAKDLEDLTTNGLPNGYFVIDYTEKSREYEKHAEFYTIGIIDCACRLTPSLMDKHYPNYIVKDVEKAVLNYY